MNQLTATAKSALRYFKRHIAHLIKIGNFQGIRIPNPLIQQTHFEGEKLDIQVCQSWHSADAQ